MPFEWIVTFTIKLWCLSFSFLKHLCLPAPNPLSLPLYFSSPSLSLFLLFSLCFQVYSLRTKARICTGFRLPTLFPVGLCLARLLTLRAEIEWVCNGFWSWFAARRYSLCGASLLSWSDDPGFPLPFPFRPAMKAQASGPLTSWMRTWGKAETSNISTCWENQNIHLQKFCLTIIPSAERADPKTLNHVWWLLGKSLEISAVSSLRWYDVISFLGKRREKKETFWCEYFLCWCELCQ